MRDLTLFKFCKKIHWWYSMFRKLIDVDDKKQWSKNTSLWDPTANSSFLWCNIIHLNRLTVVSQKSVYPSQDNCTTVSTVSETPINSSLNLDVVLFITLCSIKDIVNPIYSTYYYPCCYRKISFWMHYKLNFIAYKFLISVSFLISFPC